MPLELNRPLIIRSWLVLRQSHHDFTGEVQLFSVRCVTCVWSQRISETKAEQILSFRLCRDSPRSYVHLLLNDLTEERCRQSR